MPGKDNQEEKKSRTYQTKKHRLNKGPTSKSKGTTKKRAITKED